jgi:AcrR family transcriptional regulator
MSDETRRVRHGELPWTPSEPLPEGREPLTRDQIVDTAMRLADTEGLEAVSMRRLGNALGAGATSLYWHVKNKSQLEDLMLDAMIGEVAAEIGPSDGWRDGLAELARALRRVLIRHRNIAPLLGERPTVGPYALDAADRVMGILRAAGFDDRTTSMAAGGLINYASGFALFEARGDAGDPESPEAKARAEAVMAYFRALPPDRYPNLLAVAAVTVTDDEQFEYGLQRLLDGFEADLARLGTGPQRKDGPTPDAPAGQNAMLLR